MPGRGTVDPVFVLRRLNEKFRAKNKIFFICWPGKGFGLGAKGSYLFCFEKEERVPEYLVNGVISLYKSCKTAVSADGKLSISFSVKVGVYQGSDLSPLLFIIVMDVPTEDARDGSWIELLYPYPKNC